MHSVGSTEDSLDVHLRQVHVLSARLSALEAARSEQHADLLRTVRQLDAVLSRVPGVETVTDQLLLDLRCSNYRAQNLRDEAHLLDALPRAFEVLGRGLLTVEQVGVLRELLEPLDEPARDRVWAQVLAGLDAGTLDGLRPGSWRAKVRRWVVRADPEGAARRRQTAEQVEGQIEYRRRRDGLVDLYAYGLTGPNALACLERVRRRSAPIGPDDDRSADKRRLDAFVDLLTGRDRPGCAGAGCGCSLAAAVPCGADLAVLVPVGTALGTSDDPAELVGHGPLEPDLLTALLHAAPRLRPVWVDEQGTPVAAGETVTTPPRGDRDAVRDALLRLAALPPPPADQWEPRTPGDHHGPAQETADGGAARAVAKSTGPPDTGKTAPAAAHARTGSRDRPARPHVGPVGGTHRAHRAPTACRAGSGGSWRCGRPRASGPAARRGPAGATWTTTSPGPTGRPARATSARSADTTTGSSSPAGPRPAPARAP